MAHFHSPFVTGVLAILLSGVPFSESRAPHKPKTPPRLLISTSGCGKTKGCYFKPESCSSRPSNCEYLVTYTPRGSSIAFEMSSKERWVSVGFNHKAMMDGTDSVICSSLQNGTTVIGHYAVKGHKTPVKTTQKIKGFTVEGIFQEDGAIKCRFTREKKSNIMAVDLNKDLFVIFASGPIGDDNSLNEHSWKAHSMSPVNLAEVQILEASEFDLLLIQFHAVLMVFAWVGFATIGMFIARFMRPVWGEKQMCGTRLWFQIHRALMIFTAVLTVTGVILAFIYVGHWSEDAGAHPYIGVVVLSIAVTQPIIAFCRPPAGDGRGRLIFNWAHRSFGLIALALAVVNIFLGSVLPAFHLEDSAVYVMIVYLLAIVAVVAFELYLARISVTDVDIYRVLSKPQDDEVELTPTPRTRTPSDLRKKFRLHNIIFGVLILVVCIVCLAMLVLLTAHEEADEEDA